MRATGAPTLAHDIARPDQQPAVQRKIRHRVGRRKAPAFEVGVHDLGAVGHPLDAAGQLGRARGV